MRKRTTTTKTGCQTCKARKVKCDETRPVCRRCTSMGRKCGGYGIWTQRAPSERVACKSIAISANPGSTVLSQCSPSETLAFEWFTTQALAKLPGPFALRYWDTLIVQTSLHEPAVMYAVLALSSIHRSGSQLDLTDTEVSLRYYVRAVGKLSQGLRENSASSRLVALVSCVVFISIEFFRGQPEAALRHLQSGIRILEESPFVQAQHRRLCLLSNAAEAETNVFRAIGRQNLLVRLFRGIDQPSGVTFRLHDGSLSSGAFFSWVDAWNHLECILNDILHLQSNVVGSLVVLSASECTESLVDARKLQVQLEEWFRGYEKFEPQDSSNLCHTVIYHLLRIWFNMTSIMHAAVLCGRDLASEEHLPRFLSIIEQGNVLRDLGLPSAPYLPRYAASFNMSRSLVDVGWIPPLYFTTIHCHVEQVRIQAIELMESAAHREGIWDSKVMAALARRSIGSKHV